MNRPFFIQGMRGLEVLRQRWPNGCALTIGSFDGVHRGHQVLLQALVQQAKAMNIPSAVMVFEPQPYEYFSREEAPARLTRLREKVTRLFSHNIDAVVCLKFNKALRELSAQEYIDKVLIQGLNIQYLVIGDDFRFGCDRKGDFSLLKQVGENQGFVVSDTVTQSDSGERISSTRIRNLLEQNSFAQASKLLGDEYSISGRVVYGKQLGRELGFRTANIGLGRYRSPVHGVFAVSIDIAGVQYQAVANVGVRPTVGGGKKPLLEVHLLDFCGDIYGQWAEVKFKHKIRDEMHFSSLEALKQQIHSDVSQAKTFFNSN